MTSTATFHDPLSINLLRQTGLLLLDIPQSLTLKNGQTTNQMLDAISHALGVPELTTNVAKLFRPLLMDLCARWIGDTDNVEDHLFALCYLLEVHEELFSILNQFLLTHFEGGPLAFVDAAPFLTSLDTTRLQRFLLAYYRILQANRELPHQLLWPLSPLSKLIWTPDLDNGVRILAIRCYSLQSGMGESERLKVEAEVLGEACGVDCRFEYYQNLVGAEKEVDGWIMPVVELKRVREERAEIARTKTDAFYSQEVADAALHIQDSDLCPFIVNVHGVLLLRSSMSPNPPTSLVPTPTSSVALRQLALHVSLRLPTLLTSAPSAGKALLLSHLARLLHPQRENQIVTIHLADTSLDPRSLLGSYISSSVQAGTFEWKEGVLVRSMREGKWVVFEDVDRGSSEVLGVIKPLVESLELGKWIGGRAKLSVPSHGTVVAHDEFRLFATRSTQPAMNGVFHPPNFFGSHKFSEVIIPSPSPEELAIIVNATFPRLAGSTTQAIIRMWDAVKQVGTPASGRVVGLRELQKFCNRVDSILPQAMDVSIDDGRVLSIPDIFPNPSLREEIFLEARDVFFGSGTPTSSSRSYAAAISSLIGEHLGLDLLRQEWVIRDKSPHLDFERDANGQNVALRIGRIRLAGRSNKQVLAPTPMRPFAMHKPAISLMSRIATAVSHSEPVLLTGETGTGKTSIITHLASLLHQPLISLNLSHQTESSDLIGGLKPIDTRIPGVALQERFLDLFGATFSRRKNEKFETEVRKAVNECQWKRVVGLWKGGVRTAMLRIQAKEAQDDPSKMLDDEAPRKRRKTHTSPGSSLSSWSDFLAAVEEFEIQHVLGQGKFAFGFVEGPLVKAVRQGDWILLDEINLASPETLECISSLLHGPTASITLTEQGSLEPVTRHPNFRLFACMNPATDVGKKDLPPSIRSRFTEIDVPPPDSDKETLLTIITQYIGHAAVGDKGIIMDIADFYIAVKQVAGKRQIADGANHMPHFSMRTLARALTFATDTAPDYSLRRSVWEGCLMAFTMTLDPESAEIVMNLAKKHLLTRVRNPQSMLAKEPPCPAQGDFIKFGPFYLRKGPLDEDLAEGYIITPSVAQKLTDLSRIIMTGRFPVLIEGPTSSGKTSSIEYLAQRTGHRFVRINNHEHTDIQEYLGSYVSDPATGKLIFQDGLLVQALRYGHWIVLDELNLAPTDVLEALNRLLDDNRELVIPETQEVVRPHPHFMLFATQNPPGLYAGRKILSRAFRNRFLEVHFQDVPQHELETILCQRCQIAPPYATRIVAVFRELQKRRQAGRVFESKHGFATLRDLFRWAGRDAVGYQELADNGYMLLAERTRRPEDKVVVKEVIEKEMGVKIDEDGMYDLRRTDVDIQAFLGHMIPQSSSVVWTRAMQRLYTLVCRALRFNEPVLLVGETGSGKTSVCQIYAEASSQRLLALNCHQNTETADIIGGLRPVRNRTTLQANAMRDAASLLVEAGVEFFSSTLEGMALALASTLKSGTHNEQLHVRLQEAQRQLISMKSIFEWHDGPLIHAMQEGDVFLLDEISLADDSVLERLNSVLESGRSIVLAERGGTDSDNLSIHAAEDFKLIATMNPGGDYGKKELSPALRNRFTEIWVPSVDDRRDLELIVDNSWRHTALRPFTSSVVDFVEWLCVGVNDGSLMTIRDILAWVTFSNSVYDHDEADRIPVTELFHHAAHMTYLDGLSSLPQLAGFSKENLQQLKRDAVKKLEDLVPFPEPFGSTVPAYDPTKFVQLGSFAIPRGPLQPTRQSFNFAAPTTLNNAMRVLRSCQVNKPILLEGSPGVGKTSLVTALANLCGHKLCRINLSDQTDLIDLFGSDLPVEGGAPGEFAWRDAEFLKALQDGHWVLLDEMNLAPQAVLEGLNAVLDHRGTVFIPELNRSFKRHPSFRIFAAQNPLHQGGGRKGLPKSFVNRFTKVYVEELSYNDLYIVCSQLFPQMDENTLRSMIAFNADLNEKASVHRSFARDGSPWEFNLRDVIRWATLASTFAATRLPEDFFQAIYLHRFRSNQDKGFAWKLFVQAFPSTIPEYPVSPAWSISSDSVRFGLFEATRTNRAHISRPPRIMKMQLAALETLGLCVSQSWLAILTGPRNSGKTSVIRTLSNFTGNPLSEVSINHASDTMDILGSFEQVDIRRKLANLLDDVITTIGHDLASLPGSRRAATYQQLAHSLRQRCDRTTTAQFNDVVKGSFDLISELAESASPFAPDYQNIQATAQQYLYSTSEVGRFEWVDGPLVRAMRSGEWILLDGANLCNPSVLDRLNSLCEADGFLTLSERGFVDGQVQIIKPHPKFRLFMSVDPHYGELSRAMRNRGIEIALGQSPVADDTDIINDHHRLFSPSSQPSICGVAFDAGRRGLLFQDLVTPASSTGRSLDQDAALAHLVDDASSLISARVTEHDNSWIFFLTRTLAPRSIPHLQHYMQNYQHASSIAPALRDFLRVFPGQDLNDSLKVYRQEYAVKAHLSSDFLLGLPMYFLWIEGSDRKRNTSLTANALVFEILNLSAALLICSQAARRHPIDELRSLVEKDLWLRQAVINVVAGIEDVGVGMMRASCGSDSSLTSVKMATTLLSFVPYLRKSLGSDTYDFSSLYAISSWLNRSLKNCDTNFATLSEHARVLHRAVSLTSGTGLFNLWSKLLLHEPPRTVRETAIWTDRMAASLDIFCTIGTIRRQVFSVLSLENLPPSLGSYHGDPILLSELRSTLNKVLNSSVEQGKIGAFDVVDPQSTLLELNILALFKSRVARKPDVVMEEVIHRAAGQRKTSLLRLVPLQHFVWAVDAGIGNFSVDERIYVRAQAHWIESLWGSKFENTVKKISGPSFLFRPVVLQKVVETCNMDRVCISSLENYEVIIRQQCRTSMILSKEETNRFTQLVRVLFGTLSTVAASYSSSYDPNTYKSIQCLCFEDGGNFATSLANFVSLLLTSSDAAFSEAIHGELGPLINSPSGSPLLQIALAWIGVSRLVLDLSVPDRPIDPAAVQNATYHRLHCEEQDLARQISLHRDLERLLTGNPENDVINVLKAQLSEAHLELAESSSSQRNEDIPRLHLFWSEVLQFQTTVLSPGKIQTLGDALIRGRDDSILRERVLQESLTGFYQRLDAAYSGFADITIIIKLAILYMRLGFDLLVHATSTRSDHPSADLAESLTAFPSVLSTSKLIRKAEEIEPSKTTVFLPTLLALAACSAQLSLGSYSVDVWSSVEAAYDRAIRLWLIDRSKEKQWKENSSTLYRQTRSEHQAIPDAQLEEEDFLSIFPTFEDAFGAEPSDMSSKAQGVPTSRIQATDAITLLRIHSTLVDSGQASSSAFKTFQDLRNSTIREFLTSSLDRLPDSLDRIGKHLEFAFLHGNLKSLVQDFAKSHNFYADSNYKELRKASCVITSLRRRLGIISQEWPDQMVLKHLMERCDAILGVSAGIPVAKILSMVEQLLVQTDDWEMYANRENSIKSEREELVRLVVDWRRLELSCWQTLLDSQAAAFSDEIADWWFRLYDAIIRGPLSFANESIQDDDDALRAYLESLLPLLDDFIQTAPLGQFHPRLRLLHSFGQYIYKIIPSKSSTERRVLERLASVLDSSHSYYSLFSDALEKDLLDQKTVLEKDVKSFVKLASWKDVNVQALKQSARKTHHQLYKIIRKFRDVLRQPIRDRLQPYSAGDVEVELLNIDTPVRGAQEASSGAFVEPSSFSFSGRNHLINLSRTYQRFDSLLKTRLLPSIHRSSARVVDEAAVEIILTSKKLAGIAIPSTLSGDLRERHVKALLVRKRKAWADLLKELKHAGLASNVKPGILRQNSDALWIREQPVMSRVPGSSIDVGKGETYFLKLRGSLPALRSSLPSHHSDLTTREMQRGEAFLESGFAMAIDLRSKLVVGLEIAHQMTRTLQRFKNLCQDEEVVPGPNPCSRLSLLADALGKLSHSLSELRCNAIVANDLGIDLQVSDEFLEQVSEAEATTTNFLNPLVLLLQELRATNLPCIRADERDLILQAENHLPYVSTLLSTWLTQQPLLHYILRPLQQWLQEQSLPALPSPSKIPRSDVSKVEILIDSLLICVQSLVARCPEDSQSDEPQKYILEGYTFARDFTHLLNLGSISSHLDGMVVDLCSWSDVKEPLMTVIPFVDLYLSIVYEQLAVLSNWTKALFKLDFVLCSLLQTLCKQGFCKPPDEGEEGDPSAETSDQTGGMGVGEGSGTENVSKEIEDEGQIEGLQGEDGETKEEGKHEDGDAIEMKDDFGGALEDVSEAGSEEELEQSGDEEEPDHDETLGDLNALDPSAVDEKMWGDEKGPEDSNDGDGKTDKDHSKEQQGSSEVVAKDSKESKESKEDRRQESAEMKDEEDEEMQGEEGQDDPEPRDPNASGAPMEDHIKDAETLDLPDDMDLGEANKEPQEDGMDEDDLPDNPDAMDEQLADAESDETFPNEPNYEPSPAENEADDVEKLDQESHENVQAPMDGDAEGGEDEPQESAVAQPDLAKGDGTADPNDAAHAEPGENGSIGEAGKSLEGEGKNSETNDKTAHDDGSTESAQVSENALPANSESGSGSSGIQQGQAPSQGEMLPISNPLRSLGNALKEVRQRFEEILDSNAEDAPRPQAGDSSNPSQIEYLRPEDADHDMEALGPAREEQVAKLEQLNIIDDEMNVDDVPIAMDVDEPQSETLESTSQHRPPPRPEELTGTEQREDVEGALLRSTDDAVLEADMDRLGIKRDEHFEDSDAEVELELRKWRTADYPEDGAERIWRLYDSLTHDLAYTLCEQLRLILEPTLATRLKGDYRTGKRLNMKKVIAYIASDYTKDKIWLRRTKPSQREYQVLISIDDSRSMAESHSIHLAYQTLALISKALTRLESGDIAIAKFGETVELLRGFDEGPFTEQTGSKVARAFRFTQKATNVLSLMETSLRYLENAREQKAMSSATGADLWQLQIIISDGMCQDHEKLRTILRNAEEQRVMIVFVILDSLQAVSTLPSAPGTGKPRTILDMEMVNFKTIEGKMELQQRKYLDSFPFEYYVVLRNVEALPEVLSGTLKQFFERISEV